jgi:hypothetical protein
MRRAVIVFMGAVLISVVIHAGSKYKTTWRASDAGQLSFAGKKVAALVISGDESLRMSSEEALVRELNARGLQGVAAYRLVPREELQKADTARPWFERGSIEGLVVLRPIELANKRTYTPDLWASPYYGSLWGYYGYGWGNVGTSGYVGQEMVLTIETMIYSVPRDRLLWAGVSETKNPSSVQEVVAELVRSAAQELKKQGLTTR